MKHNLEKQSHFLCETSSWILTCIFGNLVPPNSSYSPFFIPDALLTSTVLLSQHLAPPDFLRGTEMSWSWSGSDQDREREGTTKGQGFMARVACHNAC